ncbi:MAG: phosphate/phosphite/phosphonate ABC transporter substrate-binding protein [Deltaproteobacteria bacterium]|nr:phosphate/phosphite/phosphonate ABC transporter substrate-binding protein [Deltaproteobacteria bacterium]
MTALKFVFPPSMGSARGEARVELIGESVRAELGVKVTVAVADSYEDLHDRTTMGDADLVWAPPIVASQLLPLATDVFQAVRHGVSGYHAAIITKRSSTVELDSLQGRTVAWVGKSSLAGYRLPRQLLRERGVDPDRVFDRELFVGSYPEVLSMIAHGDADVGGICVNLPSDEGLEETVYQYGGAAMRNKMRALAISERVTADCVMLLRSIPSSVATAIGDALTSAGRSRIGAAFTMALEAERFERMDEAERRALERLGHL